MATLSSSREPNIVVSRAPSPVGRARSPISRSTTPVPKIGDTATIVAFRNARDTYRKSLSEKDMKRIMIPTGPEDVVNEIEKWHERHSDSKVAAGVRGGLVRLQRFSASIDMLAQGTPSPGCLLWGSIKFVLTVNTMLILSSSRFLFLVNIEIFEPMNSAAKRLPNLWHLSTRFIDPRRCITMTCSLLMPSCLLV